MDGETEIPPRKTRRAITFATTDGEINPEEAMRPDEETTADIEAETEPVAHAPLSQAQKDIIQKIHNN
eukprot:2105296-Lingulodinium_polyedra.AAC.1